MGIRPESLDVTSFGDHRTEPDGHKAHCQALKMVRPGQAKRSKLVLPPLPFISSRPKIAGSFRHDAGLRAEASPALLCGVGVTKGADASGRAL